MKKNIWIISQSNSYILSQIVSDNLLMLGLIEKIQIIDEVDNLSILENILQGIDLDDNPILYLIFKDKTLAKKAIEFSTANFITYVDVYELAFSFFKEMISSRINHEKLSFITEPIPDELLEFAIETDDGKKPTKLCKADIVIIGISRTTKTPLSLYLTNKGYKVANIPLVPEVRLTEEIYKLDKNKVFALCMDPDRLLSIRSKRLKSLGLPKESIYANLDRIIDESNYAKDIFQKIGCKIIDVSNLSIEETADIIINTIKE